MDIAVSVTAPFDTIGLYTREWPMPAFPSSTIIPFWGWRLGAVCYGYIVRTPRNAVTTHTTAGGNRYSCIKP